MATATTTPQGTKGGSFLLESPRPEDVFTPADLNDDADLEHELLALVNRAAFDLRCEGLSARTITVRLRDMDFRNRSAQRTLIEPVVSDRVIMGVARELLAKLRAGRRVPARLLGVALSSFAEDPKADQLALFLASDESSYITGQTHLVDGGMAL